MPSSVSPRLLFLVGESLPFKKLSVGSISAFCQLGPLKNKSSSGDKETRKKKDIEAVIVAASRELGMQIVGEKEALKKNKPLIVVGTPGKIAEISAAASANGTEPSSSIQTLLLHRKVGTLRRRVRALDAQYVIAFMNHTRQLKDVVFKLEARGMNAAELHGDLDKKFKSGQERVLITNELAARVPDVPECDLVVNLDLPMDSIHYAHQAGRTCQLGRKGTVVTICEEPGMFVVKKLQKQFGFYIPACEFTKGKLVVTEEEKKHAEALR
ncbi:hypothetical protein Peur_003446 [Populus x canadensis]